MECGFFLDVVVSKCASVFELLSGKDEALLVWWNTFLVLNLSLDAFDCVSSLNIKSNSLSS